jgi:hypothetical protein
MDGISDGFNVGWGEGEKTGLFFHSCALHWKLRG